MPAAMEAFGRLGRGFERLLRVLEARWGWFHQATPAEAAATGRRWRAELGVAQARALHVSFARAARRPTARSLDKDF